MDTWDSATDMMNRRRVEMGEERNGNVSLGLLTQERWESKLGERSCSFSFDCDSLAIRRTDLEAFTCTE